MIGPCATCGTPCQGEHIVGTIWAHICDACTRQAEDDTTAMLHAVGAFARGEADLP